MKTFIQNILQRSKDLIWYDSYILRIIFCGLLISLISLYSNIGIYFIKLFISFLIFHFIFNKFTFSENIFIRLVQKASLYIIGTFILVYLLGWLGFIGSIYCEPTSDDESKVSGNGDDNSSSNNSSSNDTSSHTNTDNSVQRGKGVVESIIDGAVRVYEGLDSDSSAIAAGGAAASGALKAMGQASIGQKAVTGGAVGFATTLGTKAGIEGYNAIVDNKNLTEELTEMVKEHPYSDPDPDLIPSPDSSFVNSPLEISTPLEQLLNSILTLNSLEILLIISIIILLLTIKNPKTYEDKILNKLSKYIPIKYHNKIRQYFNLGKESSYKYSQYMLVISIILLLLIKIVNLYFIYYLNSHIDDFVTVYNHINKNSLLIILSCNTTLSSHNNRFISTIEKYNSKDILSIYSYGLENPDKIKDNNEYLEIMDVLSKRISRSNTKLLGGYNEVALFNDIILLEDNISIDEYLNQDPSLNEEYGIYDMLKYKKSFENIVNKLEEDRVYKMIFKINLNSIHSNGREESENKTSPSFLIHKNSNIEFILYKFKYLIIDILSKYDMPDNINLIVYIKEWIDSSKFSDIRSLYSIMSKKEEAILSKQKESNKFIELDSKTKKLGEIRKNKPSFLARGLFYGFEIKDEGAILNLRKCLDEDSLIKEYKYYKLPYYNIKKNYIIRVSTIDNTHNNVTAYLEISDKIEVQYIKIEEWQDIINKSENSCIRKVKENGQELLFVNNKLEDIRVSYNCKILQESKLDLEKNLKIGAFDIETYLDENNNVIPYYIGVRTGENKILYKITDFSNYDEMVLKFIDDIMIDENHNRFFYALNMSNFDGIIVLKSLINSSTIHHYKIKTLSKNDGTILSIVITKTLKNKKIIKITLADSYHLLPFSLSDLGKVFSSKNLNFYYQNDLNLLKGHYPHDFINERGVLKGLSYKGAVPDIKYFNNINVESYHSIVERINKSENGIWDSEKELINYLNKDIDILYTVMYTFGSIIYDYFNINITRIRTYSGLSFLIYTAKYYDSNKTPIYYTSGKIDKYIRDAYYGGIVDNYVTYLDKPAFKYDINSHYPNQMRNLPMPGGKPTFSTETDLYKIFGFVRARVTAPTENELRVVVLPINKNGQLITFRGTEEGVWFSEELKYAEKLGYKITVIDCLQFNKVYGLFDKFTNDLYHLKSKAEIEKDKVSRLIFKLILNSLYGRWALKDLNVEYKIIDNSKLDNLNKTEHIDVLFSSQRLSFVKSHGPVYPEIVELLEKEKLITKLEGNFNEPKAWGRNVSAVQLSAAITAYARMSINEYKNIPGNLYYGGDTDSFILEYPLDSKFVGHEIGLSKLEHVIVEGFFHSKKSYLIINNKNETIIKMKGINNNQSIVNYDTFVKLFKGEDVKIKQLQFKKDYNNMNVQIKSIIKTIKGISDVEVINKFKAKYPQ